MYIWVFFIIFNTYTFLIYNIVIIYMYLRDIGYLCYHQGFPLINIYFF